MGATLFLGLKINTLIDFNFLLRYLVEGLGVRCFLGWPFCEIDISERTLSSVPLVCQCGFNLIAVRCSVMLAYASPLCWHCISSQSKLPCEAGGTVGWGTLVEQSQWVLIVPQAGIVGEIPSYLDFPCVQTVLQVILMLIIQWYDIKTLLCNHPCEFHQHGFVLH